VPLWVRVYTAELFVGGVVTLRVSACRGIDYAVSAGDIPVMANEIPGILRKVILLLSPCINQLFPFLSLGIVLDWCMAQLK